MDGRIQVVEVAVRGWASVAASEYGARLWRSQAQLPDACCNHFINHQLANLIFNQLPSFENLSP